MNEDVLKLVAASNNFSLTLLQELLSKQTGDNIILSGFGLFTILTLFCETTTGKTEKKLVKTL